jgi:hypothetical protein
MEPAARAFFRTGMIALEHASHHFEKGTEPDVVQVVLSLDFGAEMLLKAAILNGGKSIMGKNGRSIGLLEALKEAGAFKNGSTVEILHERRNSLQHFAQQTDAATSRDLYEGAILFVEELLTDKLGEKLPASLRMPSGRVYIVPPTELLAPADVLQRDVDAANGVVVWAQGVPDSNALVVCVRLPDGKIRQLTPQGDFEYMPHTNGRAVVAYRQSGGIASYDLDTGTREVLSETGGPTDINEEWVAAQGLDVEDGLGGGVWLYSLSTKTWIQVADDAGSSSARLSRQYVVWSALMEPELVLMRKALTRLDGAPKVLVRGAAHPSVSEDKVAYDGRGEDDHIRVVSIESGEEVYSTPAGIFPYLKGDRLAYLIKDNGSYGVVVDDVTRKDRIMSTMNVGFPTGRGPVIGDDAIYYESAAGRTHQAIYRMPF